MAISEILLCMHLYGEKRVQLQGALWELSLFISAGCCLKFYPYHCKKPEHSFQRFSCSEMFSASLMLFASGVNSHSEVGLMNFPWEEKRKGKKRGEIVRRGIT